MFTLQDYIKQSLVSTTGGNTDYVLPYRALVFVEIVSRTGGQTTTLELQAITASGSEPDYVYNLIEESDAGGFVSFPPSNVFQTSTTIRINNQGLATANLNLHIFRLPNI